MLSKRKRQRQAQVALIAVDPRTGEVLALVGGRSYNQSQFNRAVSCAAAARLDVQALRLSGRLRARREPRGRTDLTPATLVDDEPTTFDETARRSGRPRNYENEYDGDHHACVVRSRMSRNVGDDQGRRDRPASTRSRRSGSGSASARNAHAYPSITLGVFEATPFEIAHGVHAVPQRR